MPLLLFIDIHINLRKSSKICSSVFLKSLKQKKQNQIGSAFLYFVKTLCSLYPPRPLCLLRKIPLNQCPQVVG